MTHDKELLIVYPLRHKSKNNWDRNNGELISRIWISFCEKKVWDSHVLIIRFLAMNLWSGYEIIHYFFSRYSKIIENGRTGKYVRGFGHRPCERKTGAKKLTYIICGEWLSPVTVLPQKNSKTGSDADTTLKIFKIVNFQTFSGRLRFEWFMGRTGKDLNICIGHWVWSFSIITNDRLAGLFNMV